MNSKFLPFAIGMALCATCVNAEEFETLKVTGESTFSGDVKAWGETSLSTLDITIPYEVPDKSGKKVRSYDKFISCKDAITPSYQEMFYVNYSGMIGATGLTLIDGSANHPYHPTLSTSYNNDLKSFLFSTSSYSGGPESKYYPVTFYTTDFTIDKGNLTVNGKITCKEELNVTALNASTIKAEDINVNLSNAADYVFDENYNLKSLSEVESYVNENKHLPGMPSAAEMAENGMSVSAMSNKLLEKVEELTLHMIRLEKENAALKAKVESLSK